MDIILLSGELWFYVALDAT